jgi:pimeloyl-ACP methyl ester carboxylesterase
MRRLAIVLSFALVLPLIACGPRDGEMLFLRHKGADMPVWVRGNVESNDLVLVVHGGPGGTSFVLPGSEGFQKLEEHAAVAYWEQRASGSSQGNVEATTITVDQFKEDLGLVVDLLRQRYPSANLYVLGYSWGGLLSGLYLTDPAAQAKVKGWIDLSGSHDVPLTIRVSRELIVAKLQQRIEQGSEVEKWKEALDWYAKNPTLDGSNYGQHTSYIEETGGGVYTGRSGVTFGLIFDSPFAPFSMGTNASIVARTMFDQIEHLDITSSMSAITLPTLVMFGKEDGQVPPAVGKEAFDALGTAADRKELVLVDKAAHAIYLDSPDVFADSIRTFIEKNR